MGNGTRGSPSLPSEGLDPQLRSLLEILPVGAYTCDSEGLITYYNRPAEELWGRAPKLLDPADRWCGSFKLYHASDGTPMAHEESWMAEAIRTGEPYNGCEIIIEREDGTRMIALAHANPLRDAEGRVTGAVNVLVDISSRQFADEAQSRLGAIVQSSDDAIISKTLDGRIVSWNAGAERILGYTADEAVGQHINLIIPAELHGEEKDILRRLRQGQPVEHYETIRVAKDGRRLNISLTSSPVRDRSGQVIGASKVARDITMRKRQEAALSLLQGMSVRLATSLDLELILEEALKTAAAMHQADFAMLLTADPKKEWLERRKVVGIEPERLEAEAKTAIAGSRWSRCVAERRQVIVRDVERDPVMEPFLETARREGWRSSCQTPVLGHGGGVIGIIDLYFRRPYDAPMVERELVELCARQAADFIENARLYEELKEADRAKNDFLATLSHELRNPLAPIRNTVALLNGQEVSPAEVRTGLEVIDRQVTHLTRLIDDLLDVSRITRNKLELRRERVDLARVLHAAIEASQPLLTARGHDFGVDLAPEPIVLDADLTRLAQVVSNLLNNAAKYTEPGGRIRVTARRAGKEAIVTVKDNGLGIPPEAQSPIFDMFTQAHQGMNSSQGGLGIGLHLARKLVELHGGTLSVKSEGAGRGSEFVIRLPIPEEAAPVRRSNQSERVSMASLRILVVDDNRDAADSLGALLATRGNEVRVAYDGIRALEIGEEFQPEAVLLDIGLPKLDGYETARLIRAEGWGARVSLIALTGWGHEEARQLSREAGFNAHLVKPVEPAVLIRKLAEMRSQGSGVRKVLAGG